MLKKTQKSATKAVAPVIGFMLILAILFLAAAQYQANVVPVQERSTEVDHFTTITEDMSGLRSSIIQSASTGQIQTQELDLGVEYNVLGLSQPARSGRLAYIKSPNIVLRNTTNNREASNFWRGDEDREYETGFLEYSINYNRITSHADIYFEHGMMYRDEARGSDTNVRYVEESEQPIIQGRSITIYTMQSNIATSRVGTTTVETQPISAPMNSVSVTNVESGSPITIQLPTRLSVDTWNETLSEEIAADAENETLSEERAADADNDNAFVERVREGTEDNTIEIVLSEGETYNLRMARIDLTTQSQRTSTAFEEKQYIAVQTQSANVRENSSIGLEAEVRDRFNNGVIGAEVTVESQDTQQRCVGDFTGTSGSDGDTNCNNVDEYRQPGIDISSADGSVRYEYNAPEIGDDRDITFTYRMDDD